MTDLEITKLCAEAMGLDTKFLAPRFSWQEYYDPLHDDEAALALVKMFEIHINKVLNHGPMANKWGTCMPQFDMPSIYNISLNRAICECVANMQKAKK